MNSSLLEPEEHVLSTLERDGTRRWLKPRLSQGAWWQRRKAVAYFLVILFIALPYIRINGLPAILLDIRSRHFTFFGFTFLPTDTLLLALFMVCVFLSIFLATALLGRVWCGWACPQTVYLEYVYRPIERLLDGTVGRGGPPTRNPAAWRRIVKWLIYLAISMVLAHAFLAYFVGIDRLARWVRQSPLEHPTPFLVMVITTGLMMFDFVFFREQLCLIACPYGRFQSVLLDRESLIVAYDHRRGEPRGKVAKAGPQLNVVQGDCVDCGACVRTCPTGIDIRGGLQMECVHCTQCIDACDAIMDRLERPRGLIRYSSQDGIEGVKKPFFRPRLAIYIPVLLIAFGAFATMLVLKQSYDVTILRGLGNPFTVATDGQIQNLLRIKLVNRSTHEQTFRFSVVGRDDLKLNSDGQDIRLDVGHTLTQPVLVTIPPTAFKLAWIDVQLAVENQDGERRVLECRLLGPRHTVR
ncbi:MAG: cytochrome c oxidase accessory protein CcoG [Pirellulales bacterium]|nr:cytochrome c oxidase accessory protein CcoG [Pirellulales bacterium]